MPGPKMPEYPKPMFKPDVDPVYARNEKHEDELAAAGWSNTYMPRAYPRMLYWPGERKNKIVANKDEQEAALVEGWQLDAQPIHYGEVDLKPNLPLPPTAGEVSEVAELRKALAEQQALLNTLLLELVTKPAPPAEPTEEGASHKKSKKDAA